MPNPLELNCEAFDLMLRSDREGAEAKYRQCLEIDPDNADALRYLGEIVGQSGRAHEAIPLLERAAKADPSLWSTWLDLGMACQMAAQTKEEMARGVTFTIKGTLMAEKELGHRFAPGQYNQALALISLGMWEKGWQLHEYGYLCRKRHLRTLKGHLWKGEYLGPDKTLFAYWEGGLGDTIWLARFLPKLKEQSGARILLEVQRPLGSLFQQSAGCVDVCEAISTPIVEDMEQLPDFDYRISLLSLPYRLGITRESVPPPPYLWPKVAPWPIRGPQQKVGICWKGNPDNDNDANRSTTEAVMMAALGGLPCTHFYSLQYGERPEEAIPLPIKNMTDMAAVIKRMDVIVTVDTAVGHLAGAMNKPVCLLIPYVASYHIWGVETQGTPLYPNTRFYRQETPGDWATPLLKVRQDLKMNVVSQERQSNRAEAMV